MVNEKYKVVFIIKIIELINNKSERLMFFWKFFEMDQRAEYRYSVKGYEIIALFTEKPNTEILPRIREILLDNSHICQSDNNDIKIKENIKVVI